MDSKASLIELNDLLSEVERRKRYNKMASFFPDEGPYRRELYPHAVRFFEAGKTFRKRGAVAANRVGKTEMINYEVTCHLTGLYPPWWNGKKFIGPVEFYAAGKTNEDTRTVIQNKMFGDFKDIGSGMIPKHCILQTINRSAQPETIQKARIQHYDANGIPDGVSTYTLKSYEQGRESFQGFEADGIHLDEEAKDAEIFTECAMRLSTRKGLLLTSFTPLYGLSKVVLGFLPGGRYPKDGYNPETGSWVIQIAWTDVPHWTPEMIEEELKNIPPHLRDARSKGIPQIGAGAIYPVAESDICCEPFKVPDFWPKVYALDVGWHKTAVAFFAQDPGSNVWYLYDEYYVGRTEPALHAEAIKVRGKWIPGVIDPASNRTRDDGSRLLEQYLDLGLDLTMAENRVEAGIAKVWQMLTSGELKVFSTCANWFTEMRCYHKDENGRIPDGQADHLMDVTKYFALTGQYCALTNPEYEDDVPSHSSKRSLGASGITGY